MTEALFLISITIAEKKRFLEGLEDQWKLADVNGWGEATRIELPTDDYLVD